MGFTPYSTEGRKQQELWLPTTVRPARKPDSGSTREWGLVSEVFRDESIFEELGGYAAIGHNRYSTTGSSTATSNIQPFSLTYRSGSLAIAHNGNLTNSRQLRRELTELGVIFQASSDTEIIPHLAARSREKNLCSRFMMR